MLKPQPCSKLRAEAKALLAGNQRTRPKRCLSEPAVSRRLCWCWSCSQLSARSGCWSVGLSRCPSACCRLLYDSALWLLCCLVWQRPLRFAARPPGAAGLPEPPPRGRLPGAAAGFLPRAAQSRLPVEAALRHGGERGDGGSVRTSGTPCDGMAQPRPQARGASGSSLR